MSLWGLKNRAGYLVDRVPAGFELPPGSQLELVSPEVADMLSPPPVAALDPEPTPPVQLTPREFMNRLSQQRQLAIMQAAINNPAVLLWVTQLVGAVYVDPAHPDTITGVQAMQAAELITAEEAAALLA